MAKSQPGQAHAHQDDNPVGVYKALKWCPHGIWSLGMDQISRLSP
jgi:hypothetical protein